MARFQLDPRRSLCVYIYIKGDACSYTEMISHLTILTSYDRRPRFSYTAGSDLLRLTWSS